MRFLALCFAALFASTSFAADLHVDFSKPLGKFRPLHGVNGGPVNQGGTVDVSKYWQELKVPIARLHDCEWPSGRVVDMHSVFPNLDADPTEKASYRFAETDDYLAAIVKTDAKIVYRLGESIEHTPRKHFAHPPRDYDRWAQASLGIIRHYNDGWAGGARHDIRYWEIWNEPENRPACWTGTDDDYYRLYRTAAKAIKNEFPKLKVGGPAVGATGEVKEGQYQPTEFVSGFVTSCQKEQAALDFFSWHTYTNDPSLYRRKAVAIRKWLDEQGLRETELHLNEWNYLPDNDWKALSREFQGEFRANWYARQGGVEGAAFVAYVLMDLLESPIDVANFFHGDSSSFGLFTQHGEPKPTYYAMRAFQSLSEMPVRVTTTGGVEGDLAVAGGIDEKSKSALILIANYRSRESQFTISMDGLPWEGQTTWQMRRIDKRQQLNHVVATSVKGNQLSVNLPAPGVLLVQITP